MHPDAYHFFANERIAGLRRDADRRRLACLATITGGRATVHHPESSTPVRATGRAAPLTDLRGG
jgi:hypothetical protein